MHLLYLIFLHCQWFPLEKLFPAILKCNIAILFYGTFHFFCIADGILLKEVNRLLRISGYFVYSAPPAYRKDKDFPVVWDKLVSITSAMCWKLIARKVQTAIWIKQQNDSCLQHNGQVKLVDICDSGDDSKPSWNTPLRNCVSLSNDSGPQKLPPMPQRLSEYSQSLKKIGSSILFCCSLVLIHIMLIVSVLDSLN